MEILIAVSLVLFMVAVGFVATNMVLTLRQVRLTMRSLELLSNKLNNEVDKVQRVTDAAAGIAGAFGGTFGKTAALAFHFVRGFFGGAARKASRFDGNSEEGEPADRVRADR